MIDKYYRPERMRPVSCRQGLDLTHRNKYDVIFLDHMMPEMDGIETLAALRMEDDNPNLKTPVICLTANAISGAREEYISAGFDDIIAKRVKIIWVPVLAMVLGIASMIPSTVPF